MAKLPGIAYTRPSSMGREDPMQPVRTAAAQNQALDVLAGGVMDASTYYRNMKIEEGENRAIEAASELVRQDAETRTNPDIDARLGEFEEQDAEIATSYREGLGREASKAFEDKYTEFSRQMLDKMASDSIYEKNEEIRQDTVRKSTEMSRLGLEGKNLADARVDASLVLSDSEKAEVKKENQTQFELGLVEQTIVSGSPDDIEALLKGLTAETYSGGLEGSQRTAAINQLRTSYHLATSAERSMAAKAQELYASNLEVAVNNGQAGLVDIEEAFMNDFISGPKRTQLILKHQTVQADNLAQADAITMVSDAITSGVPLDNRNTDHVDAVDRWFEDIKQEYANDPVKILEHAVNVAGRTNILPSDIEATLHSAATAGGKDQVSATANLYEVLEREAPQTLDKIGTKAKSVYKSYLAFVRGGTPQEDAIVRARENAYKPESEKAILRQIFASEIAPDIGTHKETLQSWMDKSNGQFDITWGPTGAPEPSNAHYSAYRSLQNEYFTLTDGDVAMSQQLARDDFKRIYSTSEINGGQEIMAYAPDREYAHLTQSMGNDLLYEDLEDFYAEHEIEGGFVMSDALTARGLPGQRDYAVYTLDESGLPSKEMVRWSPDAEKIREKYTDEAIRLDEADKRFQKSRDDYMKYRMDSPQGF